MTFDLRKIFCKSLYQNITEQLDLNVTLIGLDSGNSLSIVYKMDIEFNTVWEVMFSLDQQFSEISLSQDGKSEFTYLSYNRI